MPKPKYKIGDYLLTENQILALQGGRAWNEKKQHLINQMKSFGYSIDEIELKRFMENDLKMYEQIFDQKRNIFFQKSRTGEIKSKYTPTDIKGGFLPVDDPLIGNKYHLSWAFNGAVFVLKKIEGEKVFLDNPRHKRGARGLLEAYKKDLRHLRKK